MCRDMPIIVIDGWGISCKIALRWLSLDLTYDVNIGQDNILLQSGKVLPEPMFTQIYICHMAPLSNNELKWLPKSYEISLHFRGLII